MLLLSMYYAREREITVRVRFVLAEGLVSGNKKKKNIGAEPAS